MAESYEEIVRKWYVRLQGSFTGILLNKYRSTMTLEDAENIYQDIFLAIHRNLQEGRISADCDWSSYIIRVGLNMASKKYRSVERHVSLDDSLPENVGTLSDKSRKLSEILDELQVRDDETPVSRDPEAQSLLGEELDHTPEPCASIIRLGYLSDMTDAEIAEIVPPYCHNGKPVSVNAKAVKARRWICMQDLIFRVRMALYNAGIVDEKPKKRKRNGK